MKTIEEEFKSYWDENSHKFINISEQNTVKNAFEAGYKYCRSAAYQNVDAITSLGFVNGDIDLLISSIKHLGEDSD